VTGFDANCCRTCRPGAHARESLSRRAEAPITSTPNIALGQFDGAPIDGSGADAPTTHSDEDRMPPVATSGQIPGESAQPRNRST
jgi:hypothetical protein